MLLECPEPHLLPETRLPVDRRCPSFRDSVTRTPPAQRPKVNSNSRSMVVLRLHLQNPAGRTLGCAKMSSPKRSKNYSGDVPMNSSRKVCCTLPSLPSTDIENDALPALDLPFLLLPFRPASDPSAARTFIRNFFNEERGPLHDERLEQELLLTEPMVSSLLAQGRGKAKGNRSYVAL